MSDETKCVVTTIEREAATFRTVEKFWSDDEIADLFSDEEGFITNKLLRRAQKAESLLDECVRVMDEIRKTGEINHQTLADIKAMVAAAKGGR